MDEELKKPATITDMPTAAEPSRADRVVEDWFLENIHNSPVSRNTEAFNHLRAALDDLKRRLSKEI